MPSLVRPVWRAKPTAISTFLPGCIAILVCPSGADQNSSEMLVSPLFSSFFTFLEKSLVTLRGHASEDRGAAGHHGGLREHDRSLLRPWGAQRGHLQKKVAMRVCASNWRRSDVESVLLCSSQDLCVLQFEHCFVVRNCLF